MDTSLKQYLLPLIYQHTSMRSHTQALRTHSQSKDLTFNGGLTQTTQYNEERTLMVITLVASLVLVSPLCFLSLFEPLYSPQYHKETLGLNLKPPTNVTRIKQNVAELVYWASLDRAHTARSGERIY